MQLDMAAGDMQPRLDWGMECVGVEGAEGRAGSVADRGLYHSLSTTLGLQW